jgi:virginiamycin B lyase
MEGIAMISLARRFAFTSTAAALFASAIAACSGTSGSPLPGNPQSSAAGARLQNKDGILKPALIATEFTTGITPNSNPHGITPGPGGMWFTQTGSNQIGRISPQGVVTEFSAPTNGVNNIVEGPDGNLWFTQTGADSIGRMTPRGTVTLFSAGNEAYGPWDITNGSDGNLWFTYRSPSTTNAIGRITTSGSVTLFTNGLSPGDVAVHDISEGPDGRVWFTEEFGNRIGAITTSGTITEYSNGISTGAGLVDITAGPDGNVWFTENSVNKIGRITTGGTVTEFSHGISPNAEPGSITQSHGYVWFTEEGASNVGVATTSGQIREFPIPAQLGADIAAAPSGILWITDYTGSGIVQVK